MKIATAWAALLIIASVMLGIGTAIGSNSEIFGTGTADFYNKWQGLISAATTIAGVAATLQAGWWALSGPREQIQAAATERAIAAERKYRATRSIVLIDLNKISRYCEEAVYYINSDYDSIREPTLDKSVIKNLSSLIEANINETAQPAINMISDIQITETWVNRIKIENSRISNGVAAATLQAIITHARCLNWFKFARGESSEIDDEVTEADVISSIRYIKMGSNHDDSEETFDNYELKLQLCLHFKKPPPGYDDPGGTD